MSLRDGPVPPIRRDRRAAEMLTARASRLLKQILELERTAA